MLGMAAVLLYNVVELTKKYLSYPISVQFSVDHQQQLTFPTVAICNMSPIKKSSLEAAQTVKRRKKRSAGSGRCSLSRLFSIVFAESTANVVRMRLSVRTQAKSSSIFVTQLLSVNVQR